MSWSATTAVARGAALPARFLNLPRSPDALAAARLHGLTPDSATRRELVERWGTDPDLHRCLVRLVAGGATAAHIGQFADAWRDWQPNHRRQIARPFDDNRLTWGNVAAVQSGPTGCGYATLAVLAAAGDPALAAWLATGADLRPLPPELARLDREEMAATDASSRWRLLQREIGADLRRRAIGPMRWPAAIGSPPWTAAREARWPGAHFRTLFVADTNRAKTRATLERLVAQLARGVPAPLYVGGDVASGITTALPRHVVLAAGYRDGRVRIYEPSSGRMFDERPTTLERPRGQLAAFGHWSHLMAVLLAVG